jgi:membrane protein involved in colicin uptake
MEDMKFLKVMLAEMNANMKTNQEHMKEMMNETKYEIKEDLKTTLEKAEANRETDREERKAERKAYFEKMMAERKAVQEKREAESKAHHEALQKMMKGMMKGTKTRDANQMGDGASREDRFRDKGHDGWPKETTACHEATEADTEKIQPDPGMMQSVGEHQEVLKEASVMPVGGLRKRRRDRNLARSRREGSRQGLNGGRD